MSCWGSAVVGDPAGGVVVRSPWADDCPCRCGDRYHRGSLPPPAGAGQCWGRREPGRQARRGFLWGFSQKSRGSPEGVLLESGSFLGNCEVMRKGYLTRDGAPCVPKWCTLCTKMVHPVYQNGAPCVPKWCTLCTKMVHPVYQNGAPCVPKWCTLCTKMVHRVHPVHQNGTPSAPKWYTECTKMVHRVHPVHQNQGVK